MDSNAVRHLNDNNEYVGVGGPNFTPREGLPFAKAVGRIFGSKFLFSNLPQQLAWADIPVQEIISTTNEMTIVVKESDVNKTFSILMDLKKD